MEEGKKGEEEEEEEDKEGVFAAEEGVNPPR